jgi:hypothetical protein
MRTRMPEAPSHYSISGRHLPWRKLWACTENQLILLSLQMGSSGDGFYGCFLLLKGKKLFCTAFRVLKYVRGVAMLHKLPVCLKPSIAFPSIGEDDEASVLPAFQKLVNLFWIFDQSGAFDILQNSDDIESAGRACLAMLQKKLREVPLDSESMNDVQRADICVTRQWMRAVLWRAESNHGLLSSKSNNQLTSLSYPVQIAKEFLDVISQLPASAIEAHGPSMVSNLVR